MLRCRFEVSLPVSDYKAFRVELADKIAHVAINRPDKINAMNADFWSEIIEIFNWIEATDEVRAVVISGVGKHFSSGIDLMMLAQAGNQQGRDVGRNAEKLRRMILTLQASFNAVDNCRKPVLAAVQGYCLGGAIDLISACDMRYAAADAQFSIKEIDMGMAADVGTLQRLPRIIGDGLMREMAYTGRMVGADEARETARALQHVFPEKSHFAHHAPLPGGVEGHFGPELRRFVLAQHHQGQCQGGNPPFQPGYVAADAVEPARDVEDGLKQVLLLCRAAGGRHLRLLGQGRPAHQQQHQGQQNRNPAHKSPPMDASR